MSKKIASGSKNLVIDVKVGNGALMKNINDARKLANLMIKIGKRYQIKVICLLTNMNIPLGSNVGNSKEIEEAINILENNIDNNLSKLCIELSSYMVSLGLNITYDEAKEKVMNNFLNKNAYHKLLELIKYQKGNLTTFPKTVKTYHVTSKKSGYLTNINALEIAKLVSSLGAGRINKDDKIDYYVGVTINKKINDYITPSDYLLTIYSNSKLDKIGNDIFTVSEEKISPDPIIYEIIK